MPTPDELLDEGNTELALGEVEAAVGFYRKSVEADPAFFDGWQALGVGLIKINRADEAIEALKKAIELRPDDQVAWSSLSLAYGRNNQIKEAEDAGAKARIISWGGKVSKMQPPPAG